MSQAGIQTSPAVSHVILVRHAHTHMATTFCGLSDPPLSPEGLAQLEQLKQRLNVFPYTRVFTSDLQRARQTGEVNASGTNLTIELMPSLRELNFGEWEGLKWEQVMARDPEYAQEWLDRYPFVAAPGGEHLDAMRTRVQSALDSIADQVAGGCAVVVTHAGVIRTFLQDIRNASGYPSQPFTCDYASHHHVWREEGKWLLAKASAAGL